MAPLQDLASALLDLLSSTTTAATATGASVISVTAVPAFLDTDDGVDGQFEDLVYTTHLLTAALHILCSHALSHRLTLLGRHRGQTLSFEQFDTGALCAEVRLQTDQDKGGGGAEMEYLGVPLVPKVSLDPYRRAQIYYILGSGTYLVHYILQGDRAVDGEAHEEKVCFGV